MTLAEVVLKLIHIPREFHRRGNVSMLHLVEESGYCEVHDQVSTEEIGKALAVEPECVGEWLQESEDQRTSEGWYFMQDDKGRYIVGYYDNVNKLKFYTPTKYSDPLEACSNFIKKKAETCCGYIDKKLKRGRSQGHQMVDIGPKKERKKEA